MAFDLTAIFRKDSEGGYVAFIEEMHGVNTQGETMEVARENLREAVALVLEANRALAEQSLVGSDFVCERLSA